MSTDAATKDKVVSKGYKYFMVFLCMLTQAIPYGIAQNIQPLFIHPLVNTFHFTLASYTLIFTFGAVFASRNCTPASTPSPRWSLPPDIR